MTSGIFHSSAPSPWGDILLLSDGESLTGLALPGSRHGAGLSSGGENKDNLPVFKQARKELAAYFAGKLRVFAVPFDLAGTPFQARVWQALVKIPYGRTCSYSDLAARIGAPKSMRAVAMANARNPLPIIVPCHRVIGKNGALTGYSGGGPRNGLARKAELLRLEGAE